MAVKRQTQLFIPQSPGSPSALVFGKPVVSDIAMGVLSVSGLTKSEAEQLLDWLEANGHQRAELTCPDERSFTVRWQTA